MEWLGHIESTLLGTEILAKYNITKTFQIPVFVIPILVKMEENVFLRRQLTSVNVQYAILAKNVKVNKSAFHNNSTYHTLC